MAVIRLETYIEASPEQCFACSVNVDLHQQSMQHTGERAIAGVTAGEMKLGDVVTWEAIHFGVKQHLTSKITTYDRPHSFTDEMVKGAFKRIKHLHTFEVQGSGTLMRDVFEFEAPLGVLGRIAEGLFLKRYMEHLLQKRNHHVKICAEGSM